MSQRRQHPAVKGRKRGRPPLPYQRVPIGPSVLPASFARSALIAQQPRRIACRAASGGLPTRQVRRLGLASPTRTLATVTATSEPPSFSPAMPPTCPKQQFATVANGQPRSSDRVDALRTVADDQPGHASKLMVLQALIGLAVPGRPIRSLVAEDRGAEGVRDRTGPEPAMLVVVLVRAGSASHREPLVAGGHERSRPVGRIPRSQGHSPLRSWQLKRGGAGSNPTSSCSRDCSRDFSKRRCAPSTPRSGRRRPSPPWSASTLVGWRPGP
jgi:hypothetical protein